MRGADVEQGTVNRAILTRFGVKPASKIDRPVPCAAVAAVRGELGAVRGNDWQDTAAAGRWIFGVCSAWRCARSCEVGHYGGMRYLNGATPRVTNCDFSYKM
jgi:hypothetical protein